MQYADDDYSPRDLTRAEIDQLCEGQRNNKSADGALHSTTIPLKKSTESESSSASTWYSDSSWESQELPIYKDISTTTGQCASITSNEIYPARISSQLMEQQYRQQIIARKMENSKKLEKCQSLNKKLPNQRGKTYYSDLSKGTTNGSRNTIQESGSSFPLSLRAYMNQKLKFWKTNSNTSGGLDQRDVESQRLSGSSTQITTKKKQTNGGVDTGIKKWLRSKNGRLKTSAQERT